jgi:surface antigen
MQPDHPFADDRFGHVMYVERVDPDGAVWVTDNFNHEPVLLSRLTDEVSGPNIQYLYLPWQTQA